MNEQGVGSPVIQERLPQKTDLHVTPTTGLTEGQLSKDIGPVLEKPSFVRRTLSKITGMFKAPEESWGDGM